MTQPTTADNANFLIEVAGCTYIVDKIAPLAAIGRSVIEAHSVNGLYTFCGSVSNDRLIIRQDGYLY